MSTIRRWHIYAEMDDGERRLLNEYPFVGDCVAVMEEGDRLIADLDGVEAVECDSLGVYDPQPMTLPAGARGMELKDDQFST